MRDVSRRELVAMWIWSEEYSKQKLGAIEWYRGLPANRKAIVDDFIQQYERARERDMPAETPHE